MPSELQFESSIYIEKTKLFWKDFATKWLGFAPPYLYYSKEKVGKKIKLINLSTVYCKLFYKISQNPKYQFAILLEYEGKSLRLNFVEEDIWNTWIYKLRKFCIMSDYYVIHHVNYPLGKTSLYENYEVTEKYSQGARESFLSKIFTFKDAASLEDKEDKIKMQFLMNEIHALSTFNHSGVLKLREVHEVDGQVILLTEPTQRSTLLSYIVSKGLLSKTETASFMSKLIKIIQALHEKKILHRNLKPENIIIPINNKNEWGIKLAGFSFSCTLDPENQTTWNIDQNLCVKCGTPGYMAPEIFAGRKATYASDIFSLGVILYSCLTGEALFKGNDAAEIIRKNLNVSTKVNLGGQNYLSDNSKDLILQMINRNPHKRPSLETILQHPFFQKQSSPQKKEASRLRKLSSTLAETDSGDNFAAVTYKDAIYDLIVSPTFYDFHLTGICRNPEFYMEEVTTYVSLKTPKTSSRRKNPAPLNVPRQRKLTSLGLDYHTPTFPFKTFHESEGQIQQLQLEGGISHDLEEELYPQLSLQTNREPEESESGHEDDEDAISTFCQTFRAFSNSPFVAEQVHSRINKRQWHFTFLMNDAYKARKDGID